MRGARGSSSVALVSAADPGLGGSTLLPPDGRFSIPFLPPGLYALVLDGRAVRSVEVSDGSTELGDIEAQ